MQQPVIGISSCLLGSRVRYDGGDKLQSNLVDWLRGKAELVAICPEVAIGMGIPRPPIHLTGSISQPLARQVDSPEKDFTAPLANFGREVAEEYELDGYIFKSRSPSCGLGSTPVIIDGSVQQQTVSGIYAASVTRFLPYLPVTEAELLVNQGDCLDFLRQCRDYKNLRRLL
ncbi:MAG: DUF523 domain-containing protein [Acidiferrobacterales bacterium]